MLAVMLFHYMSCVFMWQIVASNEVYFPDCRAIDGIKRVFNVFQWLYFEVQAKDGFTYMTYDSEFERYARTDWLNSLASNGFYGITWNQADTQSIKIVVIHSLKQPSHTVISYDHKRELFSLQENKSVDFTWPSQTKNDAQVYQVDKNFYSVELNSGELHCKEDYPECKILNQTNTSINGFFNANGSTYVYFSHDNILSGETQFNFQNVLNCTTQLNVNQTLVIVAVVQGLLIFVLIAVNICIVVRGLNRKSKSKLQSTRVASRYDPSKPFRSTVMSSVSQSTSQTSQITSNKSKTKKTIIPCKTIQVSRQNVSTVNSTQDSVLGCYKRA